MKSTEGVHNSDLLASQQRLIKGSSYKNLSTVILCPTRGGRSLTPKWVSSILGLMRPMNQMCVGPIFIEGMEVGQAYNAGIEMILANPQLRDFKYVLTLEDDVLPPPDGLIKLYECMKNFDVAGALYWTKGEGGMAMCYGSVHDIPLSFAPQLPIANTMQECRGLGMGFNLFKLDMFKDERIEKPWFKTLQEWDEQKGGKGYTQDLYFYEKAGKVGYKFCCYTSVKAGHFDDSANMIW